MTVETVLDGLKAAAEPTRLRLLALCAASELTVSELTRIVGQSQPRVSRHLKVLCRAGLLTRYREQHWVYHRVPRQGPGAELVRGVLALVPAEDSRLDLDRRRLERVLETRAEQARAALAALGDAGGAARVEDEASVDALIRRALDGAPIGELLDIGTGSGRMLRLLGEQADRAVGIDISRDMLLLARSNLHAAGLDHLMVRQGNMYQLRFDDGSFDTVTIDQVLFQAEQPGQVLAEAARVLRPGGRLLLVEFLTEPEVAPAEPPAAVTAIDEERLAGWYEAAGLELAAARRRPGRPYPVIVHLAVRPGAGAEAVA